jgi:hypothetical protein
LEFIYIWAIATAVTSIAGLASYAILRLRERMPKAKSAQ